MITEIEQQTLDIDWFFTDGENIGFVASGGGKLPKSVAKSLEKLDLLFAFFERLPLMSEVIVNPDLSRIKAIEVNDQYLFDFVKMTKRGLFSFDKTVMNNFSDFSYHIVTTPTVPLKLNELPTEIKNIMSEYQHQGNMEFHIDLNSIS